MNETLSIDNKNFVNCHFKNVKLNYNGTGPTGCDTCSFEDDIYLGTNSAALINYNEVLNEFRAKVSFVGTVDGDMDHFVPAK